MKNILYFLTAILLILTASCHINNPDPNDKSITDLAVSNDFDWQTSGNINFSIKKNSSGVIVITSEDGSILFHKGFYNGLESAYQVAVNLPKYVTRVLVNNTAVDIVGTDVSVDLNKSFFKANPATLRDEDRIAYWQFNENSGSVAADAENTNDGIITGANWTTGINQSALNFNGSDGDVEIPFNNTLNIADDKISLSIWVKKESAVDDGTFLFNRTKYILRMDNHGKVTFAVYVPGWKSVTIPWKKRIVDTDWHHIVATYNGNKIKLYVDAKLLAKKNVSGNLNSTNSSTYIGSEASINFFDGTIDEVAIYHKALSKNEIADIFANTPNPDSGDDALVSWWKFNENSGNTVADSKGDNNGTVLGPQWTSNGAEGAALTFDGQNDFVLVSNADNLNVDNQFTMAAWANTVENKTAKIVEKGDWDGNSLLQDHWNGWAAQIRTASNQSYSINWGNGIPVYNEWYHLALTYNGAIMKLYVNGQLANSKQVTGPLHVNGRDFVIGSNNGAQKFFHGSIDDVRFFNKALSQTEIQAIYKNQDNSGSDDADGDGIKDSEDDYPGDPARAFNNYFPATGFGSLSFEDLWPGQGDYDFNDLVLDYRFTTVTNVSNKVVDVIGTFVIRAIGAGQPNGFGFQLPGNNLSASDITVSGSLIKSDYISLEDNGLESGQTKPTVIVFDNANEIMPAGEGFGVNVDPEKEYVDPDTIVVSMAFALNKYSAQDIDLIHFNPFMIVSGIRGKEIHLPDYPPTALVDASYFGSMDDTSDPNSGRFYKTANNLPWAINIPESFDYLIEKNEITTGYLKFYDWAASSGAIYPDWFKDKAGYRNKAVIYQVPE